MPLQEEEKPAPIKIPVDEVLKKVQKPQKKIIKQGLATIEKNCNTSPLLYILEQILTDLFVHSSSRTSFLLSDQLVR